MGRDLGPAYRHFEKIKESILPNLERFKCRYCAAEYLRNHTKMLSHLKRQCKRVPEFIKQELSQVTASEASDAIASSSSAINDNAVPARPRVSANLSAFVDSMSQNEQNGLESSLARAIFSSGSSCSIFESEEWKKFFTQLRPAFKVPGRFKLGGYLLDQEYSRMVNKVDQGIHGSNFLSIQCDSWTNIRSESIVNIIVSTPTPYLYQSISTGSESHDGEFYCEKVSEVIEKVGPKKVVGFVTDNASVMKKSWRLLAKKYPHLVTFGCSAHGLNLLCKDIMNIPRWRKLEESVNSIVKVFKKSALLSGRIKELSAQKGSEKIELKLSNKTRWVSTLLSFTSLLKSKSIIRQIAVDTKYEGSLGQQKVSEILSSQFWDDLLQISEVMKPVAKWIIMLQTEKKPMLHLVFPAFQEIKRKISALFLKTSLTQLEKKTILNSIKKRQGFCVTPAHLAAHLLDCDAQGSELSASQTHSAIDFIFKWTQKISPEVVDKVMAELAEFRSKTGIFSSESYLWRMRSAKVNVVQWWGLYSGKLALSNIAIGLLNINPTTATTERSFSTFKLIQSAKRNRLTNERAAKLVFLCHNLKLESNLHQNRLEEPLQYLGIQSDPQQLAVDSEMTDDDSNFVEDLVPVEASELESMNDGEIEDEPDYHVTVPEDSTSDSSSENEAEKESLTDSDEEEDDDISELYRLATSPNYLFNI